MNWIDYALFGVTIGTILFSVYIYFRRPDEDADKHLAIVDLRLNNLETAMTAIQTNHLPHIDAKIVDVHNDVSALRNVVLEKFARIETILEERLPKN